MKFFPVRIKGDKTIWIILFILAFVSILSVYSSTYRQTMEAGNLTKMIMRHVMFLCGGFAFIYVLHHIPVMLYKKLAPIGLAFVALLLFIVFLITGDGANRWVLNRSVQPSDIAKIIMVIYLAKVLSDGFKTTKEFCWRVIFPIFCVCGMIVRTHTSNAAIIGVTSILLVVMGTSKKKYLTITVLSVALTMGVFLGRGDTVQSRVKTWIANTFGSEEKVWESSNQADIAQFAIVSGGFFGKMPGNSIYRQKLSQAHNDFIYAIIVEEYGLLFGGIPIILLYLILFYRVILIIKKCSMAFSSLLISGLLFIIISQAFLHISVASGALPVTGQNLPMISTGGTFIIITCAAFGMILSVSRATKKKYETDKKTIENE
jgi:cell division protein FtsW